MTLIEYLTEEIGLPRPCDCCQHRERITVHPTTDLEDLADLPRARWLEAPNLVTSELVTPGWAVVVAEVRHTGPGPHPHVGSEAWHVHGRAPATRVELPGRLAAEIEAFLGGTT